VSAPVADAPSTVAAWALAPPVITGDLVLRLQRYRDPAAAPAALREAAAEAAREAAGLLRPRAVVWRGPVAAVEAGRAVRLGDRRFASRLLARVLAHASVAYVFVVTIGEALERAVDEHGAARRGLEALLLDTAGLAAVLRLARAVRLRAREVERPARVTHRVSPGYGDWPVEDQAALLGVLGEAPLPVMVTSAAWMLPRKSLSGVLGVEDAT
jgi:hypothetical protein